MARRALVVGIDFYNGLSPNGDIPDLTNASNDAKAIATLLDKHHSGDDNFGTEKFIVDSPAKSLTTAELYDHINILFEGVYESVTFYFAGHGFRDPFTQQDYLITTDGTFPNYGVPLDYIIKLANEAYPRIHNTTIILDCCHAAAIGENAMFAQGASVVGKGVTVLAGCEANQVAADGVPGTHGLFTSLLIDGLLGQAGDLFGRVTPASLYNLVDQRLSPIQQRPVYKANVSEFVMLRLAKEKMNRTKIRNMLNEFKSIDSQYPLSPACEPVEDRGHLKSHKEVKDVKFDKSKQDIYRLMQACFREGMIEPIMTNEAPVLWEDNWPPKKDGSFSMWHASLYSTGCQLTSYGQHFWKLNADGNL